METTKLTVRVPRDLLEDATRAANVHDTTLTRLVSEFFRQLSLEKDPLANAPVVRRLSGSLAPEASIEDYREYLEEKHAG